MGKRALVISLLSVLLFTTFAVGFVLGQQRPPVEVVKEVVVEAPETCWSGTVAVQMPDYPDMWWVNYGERTDNQVQICGVGLRVGDVMAFPDYSATVLRMERERDAWRECAMGGGCPDEYLEVPR